MNNNLKKGIAFSLLAAFISGFSIFYNKLVIISGIDPQIFNIIKNGGVALVLGIFLIATGSLSKLKSASFSNWKKIILIGIIGGGIPFILYFDGLRNIPAINANIIQKSMFIWVAFLAVPLLKERLNRLQITGFFLIALSNLAIGGFAGFAGSTGELLVFIATLFWSLENILVRYSLKNTDATVLALGRMFFGAFVILGYVFYQNHLPLLFSIKSTQLLPITGSIILLTGYVISWYRALKFAPATAVTSVLILATPITNILTAVFITHTLPLTQVANLVLSVVGISVVILFSVKYSQPISVSKT